MQIVRAVLRIAHPRPRVKKQLLRSKDGNVQFPMSNWLFLELMSEQLDCQVGNFYYMLIEPKPTGMNGALLR